jgi:hypothetical protein
MSATDRASIGGNGGRNAGAMIDQYPLGPDVGKPEAITQTAGISAGRCEENLWLIARGRVTPPW